MYAATTLDKHRQPITASPGGQKANPFDMGSGFVNPRRLLDPGLVYDASSDDYAAFLCSIGYTDRSLHLLTRDNRSCSNRASSMPSSLNYPSITVPNLKDLFSVSRTVTNVGRPWSVYRAAVFPPMGINITVTPQRLAFTRYGQKRKFTLRFEVTGPSKGYVFGSLLWRNRRSWVSIPLVVQTTHSKFGLW